MSLSSLYLDAFKEVAKTESFSQAADNLFVTQSALSQRVKNLEAELELTLFLRTSGGAVLTEQGLRLLRYCQTKESLENELIGDLQIQTDQTLSGTLRIGTYSSVFRSVLIPALAPLLRKNPKVSCEFICAKMNELPSMLNRGEVDLITMDYQLKKANLVTELLGKENLVAIESKKYQNPENVFLDNDSNDLATEQFFAQQKSKKPPTYRRSYFDDCYGIVDGVCEGLGKAVMSKHLIANNNKLVISKKYKSLDLEVWLHHFKQPFYSKLQQAVISEFISKCKNFL